MRYALRGPVVFFLCVILCTTGSKSVWAADDPESLIHEGIELRKAGQDARAEGYIRRAYELAPTPRATAQLGLVELAVSDFVNAETHLSEALASGHDAWILQYQKVLETSRNMARANLLRIEVTGSPPGATFVVEAAPPRPLPADGTLWIAPSPSTAVHVDVTGHKTAEFRVGGAAGEIRRIVVDMPLLRAEPPQTIPAPRDSKAGLRIAGVAATAVGVAALVVGAILYGKGTSELHDYQTAIKSDGKIPWNSQDQNWESTRNAGSAFLVSGGVALAGGLCLYFLNGSPAPENTVGSGLSLAAGAGSSLLSYGGTF
jgi:hypothetical protein